jgi:SAM-dependent methyltransferase
MMKMKMGSYDGLAWVYDRFFGPRFHGAVLDILERLLFARVNPGARILDVCCGTGRLAGEMARRGYRVTGIDSSADMLALARQNSPECDFVQADARDFDLPPVFEAAVSTFESLNHVLSTDGLRSVFQNVRRALKEGALFVFDLNGEDAYRTGWRNSGAFVEADSACFVRGGYDEETRLGRSEITVFRRLGEWTRTDLTLEQRCHSPVSVMEALASSGFTEIACYDAFLDLGMTGELAAGRMFFEAWRR